MSLVKKGCLAFISCILILTSTDLNSAIANPNYHIVIENKQQSGKLSVPLKALEAVGNLLPAMIGTILTTSHPKNFTQMAEQLKKSFSKVNLPNNAKPLTEYLIKSLKKYDGDVELPDPNDPNAPIIQEFLYPTVAVGCNKDGGIAVSKALATAGPQEAPAPGPKVGEAGIVFTALGSGGAVNKVENPLVISWWNLNKFQGGSRNLLRNPKINPTGPGTFTNIIPVGKGKIIATIFGNVTTRNKNKISSCTIIPTIGLFTV